MDMVRVYDMATKKVTTIPASELASGVIRAKVEGVEGEVWLDPKAVKPQSKLRQPPFLEEAQSYFRRFADLFHDVYPRTVEQWEHGFRCDTHPEQEIAIWVLIADAFEHFTNGRDLNKDKRQDIFKVILACAINGREHVLTTTNPLTLSKKRVLEIISFFFKVR